ncbi:hypothetical protein [Marivirga sp.]|uniref:hypothetical protein n=1 Tax=Marivirga sp. TaxID=2018662 RepID=UPI0025CD29F9|nr:hypothetical protein [Marivirga sp.]
MKYIIITLFILILSTAKIFAQSSCERSLNEARADYSSGNLYAVPGKLNDCLEEGFNKVEKIEALRLLTLTYININQQEKAKTTLIKLLNLKTDYQVIENVDPSELYSLYRKIDTDIKYFLGITAGLNYNIIRPQLIRNTNPLGNHDPDYSKKLSNPQLGIQYLYPIYKNIMVGAELQYQNQKFSYSEINDYDNENITTIEYDSNNDGINLNLNLRYYRDYYQWKPFVEVGTSGRFNLNYDFINYNSEYEKSPDEETIEKSDDLYSYRTKLNIALNANLGTMIKLGENYGEIKFGVSNYFRNHLNEEGIKKASTRTLFNGMALKDDNYVNLIYQLNFTFNIPYFNFQ